MRGIALGLLLSILLTLAGCMGKAQIAATEQVASLEILVGGLPLVPDDRDTSTTKTWETDGKYYFNRSQNAIADGTALNLISGSNELSWGIWQFNPWLESIESIQVVMSVPEGDEAYVALADYSKGAWAFDGPLTAGKSLALNDAKNRSASGNIYLAVITHGGNTATVNKLILTTEDGWVIVTVDSDDVVGLYTSLAVVGGKPAISYFDDTNKDLKYASSETTTGSNSTDWSVSTVDNAEHVGMYSSLAVVESQPAISYMDSADAALRYARRNPTLPPSPPTWTRVIVDTSGIGQSVGSYTSLEVVDGFPYIAYHDTEQGELLHAWSNTATGTDEADWATSITDNADGVVGKYNSLTKVDGRGAVSYSRNDSSNTLRYTWFGNPAKVRVSFADGKAMYTSLAVVNGKPAISWYDSGFMTLMYSYSTTERGTENEDWRNMFIDTIDDTGYHSSLAVIGGRPAISYYRHITLEDRRQLMLAWSVTPTGENGFDWDRIVVDDNVKNTGYHTSLAEVEAKPAISYYDATNGELKYAIRMGE